MKRFLSIVLIIMISLSYHFVMIAEAAELSKTSETKQMVLEKVDSDSGDVKPAAALCIDNKNVYEGMKNAYDKGYQPACENGKVTLVLPLMCSGKMKNDTITAAVDLGETQDSPFLFLNYEKDFSYKAQQINGTEETKEAYLVSFTLDLNENRINGIYPIIVNVSGEDENGNEIQKSFKNYVTITDGISKDEKAADTGMDKSVTDDENDAADNEDGMTDGSSANDDGAADSFLDDAANDTADDHSDDASPDSTDAASDEPPASSPVVLVDKSVVSSDTAKAGEDFNVTVTLKNTSTTKSVQNMVATINVPSADFEIENDSNTIFIEKLGAEKTTDIDLKFHVGKSTVDGNYPIEIALSYDDPNANTLSSTGTFVVTVEQPLNVKLTMPAIGNNLTAGETVPLSFQVMNLGRSTVYNVRCEVTGNGLVQTKTAFVGNLEAGSQGDGDSNIFISPMDGQDPYGNTTGTVTLIYEDAFGNEQTKEFTFDTTITKKQDDSSKDENNEKSAMQWRVSIAILSGIIVFIVVTSVSYRAGKKNVR